MIYHFSQLDLLELGKTKLINLIISHDFLIVSSIVDRYAVCLVVLRVVSSSVCTIFVCFAQVFFFWKLF